MTFVRSGGLRPFTLTLLLVSLLVLSVADAAPRQSLVSAHRPSSTHFMILAVDGERIGRQAIGREEVWLSPGEHVLTLLIVKRGPRGTSFELEYDLTVEAGVDYWLHVLKQGDDVFEVRAVPRE